MRAQSPLLVLMLAVGAMQATSRVTPRATPASEPIYDESNRCTVFHHGPSSCCEGVPTSRLGAACRPRRKTRASPSLIPERT
jgi:hypothetical protein